MSELAPAYVLPSFDITISPHSVMANFQVAGRQTTRHSEDSEKALFYFRKHWCWLRGISTQSLVQAFPFISSFFVSQTWTRLLDFSQVFAAPVIVEGRRGSRGSEIVTKTMLPVSTQENWFSKARPQAERWLGLNYRLVHIHARMQVWLGTDLGCHPKCLHNSLCPSHAVIINPSLYHIYSQFVVFLLLFYLFGMLIPLSYDCLLLIS